MKNTLTKLVVVAWATLVVATGFIEEDLEYVDCGSNFEVHHVNIEGCTYTSCPLYLGEETNIVINATNIDALLVSDMQTQALINRQNAAWTIELTPEDACNDWACPLMDTTHRTFKGVVNTKDYSILGAATLDLRISYEAEEGISEYAICVRVKVDVSKRDEVDVTATTTKIPATTEEDETFRRMAHVYIRTSRRRKII